MNSNQKWLNLSLVIFSAVIGLLIYFILNSVWAFFGLRPIQMISFVLPEWLGLLGGVLCFVVTRRSVAVTGFVSTAIAELVKVVWPTPKESAVSGLVILLMLAIVGLFLYGVDQVWGILITRFFLGSE